MFEEGENTAMHAKMGERTIMVGNSMRAGICTLVRIKAMHPRHIPVLSAGSNEVTILCMNATLVSLETLLKMEKYNSARGHSQATFT